MLRMLLLCFFISACSFEVGEMANIKRVSWINSKHSKLVDTEGTEIHLKGISTHGIAWYPDFYHEKSILWLKNNFKINAFRIAMYTEEWGGYISNRSIINKVYELIDACIKLNLYVIVDWHILKDGNPTLHENEAKEFFDIISKKYADVPNVIYEIMNEPNGWANWWNSLKGYAERVIPVIRKNSPKAHIIVGTGTWSQDIHDPAKDPLNFENVSYALHFYAGTHGKWLRDRIDQVTQKGLTVFVSEFGTSQANGSGGVHYQPTLDWLNYLDRKKISYINWSLTPKNESSAILKPWSSSNGNWTDDNLTASGKMIKDYYNNP